MPLRYNQAPVVQSLFQSRDIVSCLTKKRTPLPTNFYSKQSTNFERSVAHAAQFSSVLTSRDEREKAMRECIVLVSLLFSGPKMA